MIIQELYKKRLISPPSFMPTNIMMLCMTGSVSYGCSTNDSDLDIVGVCIPPKEYLFPTSYGEIEGFGYQKKRFEQWQKHHIKYKDKEYDFSVYNIAKYFQLVMDGNPNMVDSLFVPRECIIFSTKMWELVRENRNIFLSKKMWARFKGYSYSQLNKMSSNKRDGKRKLLYDKYGYDIKFAYHVVRLLLEVEQILSEGDLDLQRNKEQLKSIRRGEWTEDEIKKWASKKESDLESLYIKSPLPYSPNESEIKELLLQCLKMHYGDIKECKTNKVSDVILDLEKIIEKHR